MSHPVEEHHRQTVADLILELSMLPLHMPIYYTEEEYGSVQALSITKDTVGSGDDKEECYIVSYSELGNCNCTDCDMCDSCYNCTKCYRCYKTNTCSECAECSDCVHCKKCVDCKDCSNCTDCIGCSGCIECEGLEGKTGWVRNKAPE